MKAAKRWALLAGFLLPIGIATFTATNADPGISVRSEQVDSLRRYKGNVVRGGNGYYIILNFQLDIKHPERISVGDRRSYPIYGKIKVKGLEGSIHNGNGIKSTRGFSLSEDNQTLLVDMEAFKNEKGPFSASVYVIGEITDIQAGMTEVTIGNTQYYFEKKEER